MENKYKLELELALIDVLDGQSEWYEIQDTTGLSERRCKEIQEAYVRALENFKQRAKG